MRNKGFTLIELLAVIVILAIIALITVPVILSSIGIARIQAVKSSAYGYINAIEYYVATTYTNNNYSDEVNLDGQFDFESNESNIDFKGNKPTSVDVFLLSGRVYSGTIVIDGYNLTVVNGIITNVSPLAEIVEHQVTVSGTTSCTLINKTIALEGDQIIINTLQSYVITTPTATTLNGELTVDYISGIGFIFIMPNEDVTVNVFCYKPEK